MSGNISASNASTLPSMDASRLLKVGGITPFTATDYPDKLAAVVYVQGCPWRCGYCHNPHLQLRTIDSPLHWSSVLALLKRRVGLIDAVVFSGGESTIDPALHDAISDVRALGFNIGLHTAGTYPKRLAEILPLVDWVGLDIKAPFEHYERITAVSDSGRYARESAEVILKSDVQYEFRTTIHPTLLNESALFNLAKTLSGMGVQNYALQIFRAQGCRDDLLNAMSTAGYPSSDLVQKVSEMFAKFTLRRA